MDPRIGTVADVAADVAAGTSATTPLLPPVDGGVSSNFNFLRFSSVLFCFFFLFFVFVSDSDVFPFYFVTYVDVNLRHRKALRSSSLKTKNAQKNNNKRGVYVEGEKKKLNIKFV